MSVITAVLLVIILFLARHELLHAWQLLSRVNIGILLLIIPIQMLAYYATGEMIFEYLRTKGAFSRVSRLALMRMSLELNFVNHTLPSGGVSGVSYMAWRLGKYGVSAGRATMAQVVRYATGFAAFITLLLIAVLMVTADGNVNRWIIFVSSALVGVMVTAVLIGSYVLSSKRRLDKFSTWIVGFVNALVAKLTFGRVRSVLKKKKIETFFEELHTDFLELRRDKRGLIKPYLWGIVLTISEAALFMIAFWALGASVNPAPILIAYGLASMAGFFIITPGGAGAYEAIMVAFLALAGIESSVAIAGILLTRVILLISTVVLGYAFYQHAILKYGKGESPVQR
jgi:uncharacterized protein (TIRG00374 family)